MTGSWPPPGLDCFARALPWEYRLRGVGWDASVARWRMEAETAANADLPQLILLMMADGSGSSEDWCRTLATWALQTAPTAGWVVAGSRQEPWQAARIAAGLPAPTACITEVDMRVAGSSGHHWALAAHAGDLLHPSLAWNAALAAAEGKSGVGWDWLEYADSNIRFELTSRLRAPWRDMVRELHTDTRGRAFALPVAAWIGFPSISAWQLRMGGSMDDICSDVHLHSEPLAMYRRADVVAGFHDSAHALLAAESHWRVPFVAWTNGDVAPAATASSVSVVLMYRDRPEQTIAAIQSVLAQQLQGDLELVLVDNASTAETVCLVEAALVHAVDTVKVTRVTAPGPFNHSAQAAQAANAASGDVLLFLNNDARLLQLDAIESLARWALLPNVASVGAAFVDVAGAVVGGGMHPRALPGAEFNSPVEEARGGQAAHARQVIGNSFACAAVSAVVWRALGGLDVNRFPAGYNDVDYCLRAFDQGWTHINLGQVAVHHAVGASRARQDEIAQKVWLRSRYPWVAAQALHELSSEPLNLIAPGLPRLTVGEPEAVPLPGLETRESA